MKTSRKDAKAQSGLVHGAAYWVIAVPLVIRLLISGWLFEAWVLIRYQRAFLIPSLRLCASAVPKS